MSAIARRESKPMCAVCGRPVERFTRWDDEFVEHSYFVATCHGKKQRVRVDFDTMHGATAMGFGLAFADEQRRLT